MIKKIIFLKNMDERSLRLFKHIGFSSIFKGGSILIGLVLVPLSISYLGSAQYGLWLTLFSFLGWFNIVDFGIGNGLRNKLAQAFANKDMKLAKNYISTAYFTLGLISFLTFLFFMIIFPLVDWHIVFNFDKNNQSVRQLIFIAFVMFSINLSLKNINVLFYADQKASLPELFSFLGQLLTLVAVYFAMVSSKESLLLYGIIILGSQMLILFLSTFIFFLGKYKDIAPNIRYFHTRYVKDILVIGGKFFIIQISAMLFFTTDNFIINYVLGSSDVTIYNIPYKYFMLVITIMTIVATPYWSAFTDAYARNDDIWIRKSMKNLFKISAGLIFITIVMIIVSKGVFFLWLGNMVNIPFLLTLIMGLNAIIRIFIYPISMFLNGVGKMQIQLYLGFILAIINIPLSIFLAKNMELGVSGVILATLLVRIIELIILPVQVKKIINKNAYGLWNA